MDECLVCFDQPKEKYTCKCGLVLCPTCLKDNFNFCLKENLFPLCPGRDCEENFSMSSVGKILGEKGVEKYAVALVNSLYLKSRDKIDFYIGEKIHLENLRINKIKFIRDTFPASIYYYCKIVHSADLEKIQYSQKAIYDSLAPSKKCPRKLCYGYLEEGRCILCKAAVCPDCDVMITGQHQCKEEDLAAIAEMKKYISCPGCGVKGVKDYGCSSITCVNCGIKYLYKAICPQCKKETESTNSESGKGEEFTCTSCDINFVPEDAGLAKRGGHGNGQSKMLKDEDKDFLVDYYTEVIKKPDPKILQALTDFAQKRPLVSNDKDKLDQYIVAAQFTKKQRDLIKAAKYFEKCHQKHLEMVRYTDKVKELEVLIRQGQLTLDHIVI